MEVRHSPSDCEATRSCRLAEPVLGEPAPRRLRAYHPERTRLERPNPAGAVARRLLQIDPRPCSFCGVTTDRHEAVDGAEGPEFYCADLSPDDMTVPELERRGELRRQEDIAAIFCDMEASDRPGDRIPPSIAPTHYRPAQSTVDAFRLVAAEGDVARLRSWLADRPKDAPALIAMLESSISC